MAGTEVCGATGLTIPECSCLPCLTRLYDSISPPSDPPPGVVAEVSGDGRSLIEQAAEA